MAETTGGILVFLGGVPQRLDDQIGCNLINSRYAWGYFYFALGAMEFCAI